MDNPTTYLSLLKEAIKSESDADSCISPKELKKNVSLVAKRFAGSGQ